MWCMSAWQSEPFAAATRRLMSNTIGGDESPLTPVLLFHVEMVQRWN